MRSRGAIELARADATQEAIGRACEVSQQTVQRWISGEKKPAPIKRELLREMYGIEPAWWDEAIAEPPPPKTTKPLSTAELAEKLRLEATRMFEQLEAAKDRTLKERATALDRIAAIVERLAKLTGEDGRRLLRAPQWLELRQKIVETLAKFPDAREAVLQVFEAAEEES